MRARAFTTICFVVVTTAVMLGACGDGGGGGGGGGGGVDPAAVSKMTGAFSVVENLTDCDGTKSTDQYRVSIIPEELQPVTYIEDGVTYIQTASSSGQVLTINWSGGGVTSSIRITFSADYATFTAASTYKEPGCTSSSTYTGTRTTLLVDAEGNTRGTARSVAANSTTSAMLNSDADVDYFRVTISSAGALSVKTTGNLDTEGYLTDESGSVLAYADDSNDVDMNFSISKSVAPGTYYIVIRGYDQDTGPYNLVTSFRGAGVAREAPEDVTGQPDQEHWTFLEDREARPARGLFKPLKAR